MKDEDNLNLPFKIPITITLAILVAVVIVLNYVNAQKRQSELAELKQQFCSVPVTANQLDFIYNLEPDLAITDEKQKYLNRVLENLVPMSGSIRAVVNYKQSLWSISTYCRPKNNGNTLIESEWGTWQSITSKSMCEAYKSDNKFSLVRSVVIDGKPPVLLLYEKYLSD